MKQRKWIDRILALVLAGVAMLVFNTPPVLASSADSAIGQWKSQHIPGLLSNGLVHDISISPSIPDDIPGGASNATLKDAAKFAWQEFIALNWPAVKQTGAFQTRGMPDTKKKFSEQSSESYDPYAYPLVWETLRNRVEVYPDKSHQGNPVQEFDHSPTYDQEYGYDVGPCNGTSPDNNHIAWVNLDEGNEIGRATMFAGVVPPVGKLDPPSGTFANQQFLYLAKANRAEYDYVKKNGWMFKGVGDAVKKNTAKYISENQDYPPYDSTSRDYVSFPPGTIEVKSAWRQLRRDEISKFHTAPVRYYKNDKEGKICYVQTDSQDSDEIWGMAALHIMHKTPSAPYFTFATFSQADNIVDAEGNPVEDADGNLLSSEDKTPTDPPIVNNTDRHPPSGAIIDYPATPTLIQEFVSPTDLPKTHSPDDKRLYYRNTSSKRDYTKQPFSGNALPQLPISVNKRQHPIPKEVIDINKAAHDLIKKDDPNSPWLNYKLVNVQWVPLTKNAPGLPYEGEMASTYYLSNEVVETNYNLQSFSGQLQPLTNKQEARGLITDFDKHSGSISERWNILYKNQGFNMGGCLGCHGNAANEGTDFSFILASAGGDQNPKSMGDPLVAEPREFLFDQLLSGNSVPKEVFEEAANALR